MDVRRVAMAVAGLGVGFVGLGLAVTPWLGGTETARCRTYGAPAFRGIDGWMLVGDDGCNEIRFSLFAAIGFVLLVGAGVIGAAYLYQNRVRPYIAKMNSN
jgi:drug/metabolite transporter (DMT)-like permease